MARLVKFNGALPMPAGRYHNAAVSTRNCLEWQCTRSECHGDQALPGHADHDTLIAR
jgi:hypothetical protein